MDGARETFQTLVNPGCPIPPQVTSIHGITDAMVADSPRCEDVLSPLIEFIGSSPLVIHNTRFDLSFLDMECRRANRRLPAWVSYDTVVLSRKTFPAVRNHKLDTLCEHFALPLEHHRALQDAVGCGGVFRRCIETADPDGRWTAADLDAYIGSPDLTGFIRELPFKERLGVRITIGRECVIRYTDSEGNSTERKILPKKIYKKGKHTVIFAYCYLRNEDRYFKANRIDGVIEG